MIQRSFDYQFIDSILQHPRVKRGAKYIAGDTARPIVESIDNYLLVNEWGGFIVIKKMPFTYECHTQFLPEGRGEKLRSSVDAAIDYMFINTDCHTIITKAYKDNPASIQLSREYFSEEGETPAYYYYRLHYSDWIKNASNREEGILFHQMVDEIKDHEDDDVHDCYVGAAIRMAKSGNIRKGQFIYNDWAVMSGYESITIVNEVPLLIDVGAMRLELTEEVRLCQQVQQ